MACSTTLGLLVDLFLAVLGLILYLFDVGSDVYAAVIYGQQGHYGWMAMTGACIYMPRLVFVLAGYIDECVNKYKEEKRVREESGKRSGCRRCVASITGVCAQPLVNLLLLPASYELFILFFQFDYIYHIYKDLMRNNTEKPNSPAPVDEDAECTLFTLNLNTKDALSTLNQVLIFEAAFEAAPQFILQLHIILRFGISYSGVNNNINSWANHTLSNGRFMNVTNMTSLDNNILTTALPTNNAGAIIGITEVIRIAGLLASLLSVSWTVSKLYFINTAETLDARLEDVLPTAILNKLTHMLWRTCMVAPRLLSLAFFASLHGFLFLCFPVFHSIAVFIILTVVHKKSTADMPAADRLYSSLVSNLDFIFSASMDEIEKKIETMPEANNLLAGKAMYITTALHYVFLYIENFIMIFLVCMQNCPYSCQFQEAWHFKAGFGAVLGLPVLGILFFCIFQCQVKKHLDNYIESFDSDSSVYRMNMINDIDESDDDDNYYESNDRDDSVSINDIGDRDSCNVTSFNGNDDNDSIKYIDDSDDNSDNV